MPLLRCSYTKNKREEPHIAQETEYAFQYSDIHFSDIRKLEWSSNDMKNKIHRNLHEVLGMKGRIVLDIDISNPGMIKSIYENFPPDENYVPRGFTDVIERKIAHTVENINPEQADILRTKRCAWVMPLPDNLNKEEIYKDAENNIVNPHLTPDRSPFCWSHACREGKLSFHITLPLWVGDMCRDLYKFYTCLNRVIRMDVWFNNVLKGTPLIDMNLCRMHHQLRLPGQTKKGFGEEYRLKYLTNHSWLHAMSSIPPAFLPNKLKLKIPDDHSTLLDRAVMEEPEDPKISYETLERVQSNITFDDICETVDEDNLKDYNGLEPTNTYRPDLGQVGYKLKKRGVSHYCPVCDRVHDRTTNTPFLKLTPTNKLVLACWQDSSRTYIDIENYGMTEEQKERKKESFANWGVELYGFTRHNADDVRHEQILSKFPLNRSLIVKSCVGTGKTKQIQNLVRKCTSERILVLTNRITFAREIVSILNKCVGRSKTKFGLYGSYKGWTKANRLVCRMESLRHLHGIDPFDIVILDEMEGLMKTFYSDTMKDKIIHTYSSFCRHIKRANIVWCMDAFFTDNTSKWLKEMRNDFYTIYNTYTPGERRPRKIHRYKRKGKLQDDIENSDDNKFIVCTSKNTALSVADGLNNQGKSYILHCGDVDHTRKSHPKLMIKEADPSIWDQYENVIVTPTVLNGISFEKEHFDILCIFDSHCSVDPHDLLQMTYRVRNFRCSDILMHLDRKDPNGGYIRPVTLKGVQNYLGRMDDDSNISNLWNYYSDDTFRYVMGVNVIKRNIGQRGRERLLEKMLGAEMGYTFADEIEGKAAGKRYNPIEEDTYIIIKKNLDDEPDPNTRRDAAIFDTVVDENYTFKYPYIFNDFGNNRENGKNIENICRAQKVRIARRRNDTAIVGYTHVERWMSNQIDKHRGDVTLATIFEDVLELPLPKVNNDDEDGEYHENSLTWQRTFTSKDVDQVRRLGDLLGMHISRRYWVSNLEKILKRKLNMNNIDVNEGTRGINGKREKTYTFTLYGDWIGMHYNPKIGNE